MRRLCAVTALAFVLALPVTVLADNTGDKQSEKLEKKGKKDRKAKKSRKRQKGKKVAPPHGHTPSVK